MSVVAYPGASVTLRIATATGTAINSMITESIPLIQSLH